MRALPLPIKTPPIEKAAPIYQKALDNSGYKHLLTFSSHF